MSEILFGLDYEQEQQRRRLGAATVAAASAAKKNNNKDDKTVINDGNKLVFSAVPRDVNMGASVKKRDGSDDGSGSVVDSDGTETDDSDDDNDEVVLAVKRKARSDITTAPAKHDVLLGRGGMINSHPGNVRFRRIVSLHKVEYANAIKVDKPKVAQRIVRALRNERPAVRFLQKLKDSSSSSGKEDGNEKCYRWHDVGDKIATEKTSQALRCGKTKMGMADKAMGGAYEQEQLAKVLAATALYKQEEHPSHQQRSISSVAAKVEERRRQEMEEAHKRWQQQEANRRALYEQQMRQWCFQQQRQQWQQQQQWQQWQQQEEVRAHAEFAARRRQRALIERIESELRSRERSGQSEQRAAAVAAERSRRKEQEEEASRIACAASEEEESHGDRPLPADRSVDAVSVGSDDDVPLAELAVDSNEKRRKRKQQQQQQQKKKNGKTKKKKKKNKRENNESSTKLHPNKCLSWEDRFKQLRTYKAQHGDVNVPLRYKFNPSLGGFVHSQRKAYRKREQGKPSLPLTAARVAALEELGFEWRINPTPKKATWEERIEDLRKYRAQHGDVNVPQQYSPNPSLGNWCTKQRCQYSKMLKGQQTSMTAERVAELDKLGFSWSMRPPNHTWEQRLLELREYHKRHRDANGGRDGPIAYPGNTPLTWWVHAQRAFYKQWKLGVPSSLTAERIAALEEIGFAWDASETRHTWDEWFNELREYQRRHGDANVPHTYPPNQGLSRWVRQVRVQHRKLVQGKPSTMTKEKAEKLERIGFVFDRGAEVNLQRQVEWGEMLDELRRYKDEHGSWDVPTLCNGKRTTLGLWVSRQRSEFRRWKEGKDSRMSAKKAASLDAIGFDWKCEGRSGRSWEKHLDELREFKRQHGHASPPQQYSENTALGHWVNDVRKQYSRLQRGLPSTLNPDRIKKLNELGFLWAQQV